MMKHPYLLILPLLLAVSCFEDLSTEVGDIVEGGFTNGPVKDIVISVPGVKSDTLLVPFGDTIKLEAEVSQEGYDSDCFTYLWTIDLVSGRTDSRIELSDTKKVEYKMISLPSPQPYFLELTVRNEILKLETHKYWRVIVTNSLGEGLLVAHTRDGGLTSELDLVCDSPITYGYSEEEPRYVRDLMGLMENPKIEGTVKLMNTRTATDMTAANIKSFNEDMIIIALDGHILALDPVSYKIVKQDSDLFTGKAKDGYDCEYMSNLATYTTAAVFGGAIYGCSDMLDDTYQRLSYPNTAYNVFSSRCVACDKGNQGLFHCFDPVTHEFFYALGVFFTMNALSKVEDIHFTFDINSAEPFACGSTKNGFIYVFNVGGSYKAATISSDISSPTTACYDLTLPDVENAVQTLVCDNTPIFYYATKEKVYATIFSSKKASTKALSWKLEEGEEITGIQQYNQAWYGTHQYWIAKEHSVENTEYPYPLSAHRLRLIITTYNKNTGVGKLYLKPFNVSTGMFPFNDEGCFYEGFGRITAVTSTMR